MRTKHFIGFVLIVFGLLLLLQNLSLIPNVSLFKYLIPVVIIGIGVVNIINNKRLSTLDLFLIIIGALWLAESLGLLFGIEVWSLVFPIAIVFLGFKIFTKNYYSHPHQHKKIHKNGLVNDVAIFSGTENKYVVDDFHSGDVTAIFGGCSIDLSDANTSLSQCFLEANAIFGGVDIIVPNDWVVDVKVTPIFGGCENKTFTPPHPKAKLLITGNAVFGGIEIKSKPRNEQVD